MGTGWLPLLRLDATHRYSQLCKHISNVHAGQGKVLLTEAEGFVIKAIKRGCP